MLYLKCIKELTQAKITSFNINKNVEPIEKNTVLECEDMHILSPKLYCDSGFLPTENFIEISETEFCHVIDSKHLTKNTADWNIIETTKKDLSIIEKIVKRYIDIHKKNDAIDVKMAVCCVHYNTPLKLQKLLDTDYYNFFHDLNGIHSCLNRETGELTNYFLPRFTK